MLDSKWIAATAAMMGGCVFGAAEAHAKEGPADETEDQAPPPDWLLGAGVGIGGIGLGGVGVGGTSGVGSIGGFPMLYGAGIERRLSPSLWLFGDLGGSFVTYEDDSAYPSSQSGYSLDGRLGLRPVINPEDRIQLSLLASLGASLNRFEFSGTTVDETGAMVPESNTSKAWSIHADAGIAVDFWLSPVIALRLDTGLLRVAHQRSSQGGATATSWAAELRLSPSVGFLVGF